MSQSGNVASSDASVWKVGSLSVDELERLAGEIRPSWEIGLDAASEQPANAAAAMIVPTASGFTAAPNAVVADLGGLGNALPKGAVTAVMNAALAPPVSTLVPQHASSPQHTSSPRLTSPIPLVAPARPPQTQMAYDDAKTEQSDSRPWEDDPSFAPKKKSNGLLFGGLAAGVVVAGLIAFFAMRGGEATPAAATSSASSTPTPAEVAPTPSSTPAPSAPAASPSTTAMAVVQPPAPVAPAPVVEAPPPAPVVAPVPPAPVVAAAPPPAPVIAAPRPAPAAPAQTHAAPVAAAHVASPTRPAAAPAAIHHAAAPARRGGSRTHGAGFVTDSPY